MSTSHQDFESARNRIAAVYAPDQFERFGKHAIEMLASHFRRLLRRDGPVLNWREPRDNIEFADELIASSPPLEQSEQLLERFVLLARTILTRGQNLHHPRYLGHQVPASVPLAALFDAIGSATNQVMAIYEMGPWATAVEQAMIGRLGHAVGYEPGTFAGICTHGGSLANLTALLTARNLALADVWQSGLVNQQRPPALVVQNDVHYSVTRAAGVLGIGTQNLIKIPVDQRRKMRVSVLDETLEQLRRDGRPIVAVVAGACATPIGAFDPLDAIADVCQRHEVWMHVDAAHGGAALLSDRHRHLVEGVHRADSIVWDAHKMLFMPALCAFVFYRDAEHQFATFQQDAPYLFDPANPGIAEYDSGTRTLECTKRAAALATWGTWCLFGRQLFSDLVDVTFELAQRLYQTLAAAEDFVPLHSPECNIQAFRYVPAKTTDWPCDRLGEFQLRLRRSIIESGDAYLVPIKLDGIGALRVTLINPLTSVSDLNDMLDIIRTHGDRLVAELDG